jgi:hypothetical protein
MPVTQPPAASGTAGYLSSWLTRYVDPVNGSDANTGLSPATAYASIPFAYTTLVTDATAAYADVGGSNGLGVGRIILSPGTHTLTARIDMDFKYPVEIIGTRSGRHSHLMSNSASTLRMNSTTATAFFRVSGTNVGYGWRFENFHVLVDQTAVTGNVSLTCIWDFQNVDDFQVENCSWDTLDNTTNMNIPAINHDASLTPPTGDAAWFRIRNNRYSRLALYDGGGSGSSGNFNRWTISQNVGFYGGTIPHVKFSDGAHGGTCENNNLEGTATAVELAAGSFTHCTFENNSGEDSSGGTPANPFYKVSGSCSQVHFIGGTCSVPSGGLGVWIEFSHASAYNNLVIGPYDYTGVAGEKRKIIDSSTANGNRVINTTSGALQRVKISSGTPTWADGDFAPAPMDGTTAIGINTTTGERRLWFRANGTWGYASSIAAGNVAADTIFDAKGDLAAGTGADTAAKLTVGANGTVLRANSAQTTGLEWADPLASPAFTGNPTAPTQTAGNNSTRLATTAYVDTADGLLIPKSLVTTKGDIIAATAASTPARLAVGSDGQVLTADAASTPGVKWATPSGGGSMATDTLWNAAGDLAVGTGSDTATRLGIGSNGNVLTSNGTTATWAAPGAGPFTVVARTSDTAARNSGNTGSTLTADDTLLFAVSGNSTDVYFVEMILLFSTGAAGATSDAKAAWNVPSGTTIKGGYGFVAGSAGFPGSPASATSYSPTAFLAAAGPWVWAMGNSTEFFARGELFVYVGGTSGNVVMTWAQNTSDASNLILTKGSHLRITKVI